MRYPLYLQLSSEIDFFLLLHMADVVVQDKIFQEFISADTIQTRLEVLAQELNEFYKGLNPILLPVLNGSFIFAADLVRKLDMDPELQFIKVQSYHGEIQHSGSSKVMIGVDMDLKDRHILLIEDIVDTGRTNDFLREYLGKSQPASIRMATLLFKPSCFVGKHHPEYVGFEIPEDFVIGYGLDYAQKGRELDAIYHLKP